jgi:hypothetical protein
VTRHERVLSSHPDAPWLPPGGRADVVLAQDDEAPDPTCLVRLLVVRDGSVLCVPRDGRGKEDLPTRVVPPGGDALATVEGLARDVLGELVPLDVLGFVRNTVAAPTPEYPWPWPLAHFTVWRAEPSERRPTGIWRSLADPGDLVERHWWPLAHHVLV